MDDITIFVPSRSRFDRSLTLEHLSMDGLRAVLVVPYEQAKDYARLAKQHGATIAAPKGVSGISLVRQWCGKNTPTEKFVMIDDDLRFSVRIDPTGGDTKLRKAEQGDMAAMIDMVARKLDIYAHVAVSARQANHGLPYHAIDAIEKVQSVQHFL